MTRLLSLSLLALFACSSPVEASAPEPATPGTSGPRLVIVRAAVAGDEIAVLWARQSGPLALSRFSLTGQRRGEDVVLAPTARLATLATDGARFAACWGTGPSPSDGDTDIACATVPVGGEAVSVLTPFSGFAPALTRGPRGLMLAYGSFEPQATSGKTFRIHLRELEGAGASWSSELLGNPTRYYAALQVTSTPSGFFIAAFDGDKGFRVAHDLTTAKGPFPIGDSYGAQPGTENIVAIGDTVAINRAIPYKTAYTVIDDSNRVTTSLFVGGGVKLGHSAFLWAEAGSFRAAWQETFEGDSLQRRDLPLDAGRIEENAEGDDRRSEQRGSRMTVVASPAGPLLAKDGATGVVVVAFPQAP